MTPGMCSRKHYVLVMSSLTKLQSLRSGPWCQWRQLGQVGSTLKASLPNFLLTGHYPSQREPLICCNTAVILCAAQGLHSYKEIRSTGYRNVFGNTPRNSFSPVYGMNVYVASPFICNGSLLTTRVCVCVCAFDTHLIWNHFENIFENSCNLIWTHHTLHFPLMPFSAPDRVQAFIMRCTLH